jgi:hypothetical protein
MLSQLSEQEYPFLRQDMKERFYVVKSHYFARRNWAATVQRPRQLAPTQDLVPVFRDPDHVVLQVVGRVRAMPVFRHPSILVEDGWKLTT